MGVEAYADRMDRPDVDRVDTPGEPDTPNAALRRFRPENAGLEATTRTEADAYIAAHAAGHPWLRAIAHASPEARSVLVSLVRGHGHAVERHEGGVTPAQTDARVRRLEDPAIGADADRRPGRDAYRAGKTHGCGDYATRIADPDAFAVCFTRGVEHPRTRDAFAKPAGPGLAPPSPVRIQLDVLLGPDGHRYCDGHRLKPVHEDGRDVAKTHRSNWITDHEKHDHGIMPEPESIRLRPDDFKGSVVEFHFRLNRDKTGWEIATMYVEPPKPHRDSR
ncbi:MAG TPA: hypothetical protein VGL93_03225 [Streptosporangiaceae bacterium]|jgi:hypothetical protein